MFFFIFFSELLKRSLLPDYSSRWLVLLRHVTVLMLGRMRKKTVKRCEACKQPFEADPRTEERQAYCSSSGCQRERRRRSQRHRRIEKSSFHQPRRETPGGGENSSRLHGASRLIEADTITEDPLILGLMSMLCGTDNLDELQAMMMRLKIRGQKIAQ